MTAVKNLRLNGGTNGDGFTDELSFSSATKGLTLTLAASGSSTTAFTIDSGSSQAVIDGIKLITGTASGDTFQAANVTAVKNLRLNGGTNGDGFSDTLEFSDSSSLSTISLTASGDGTVFTVNDGTNNVKIDDITTIKFADGIDQTFAFTGASLIEVTGEDDIHPSKLTIDFGKIGTSELASGVTHKLTVTDGTASGDYRFTFDSVKAATTSIEISDTDGTADAYEFFGGIFADAEDEDAIATALTSIKGKFTFSDGQFTIKGLDKADGGNATGVVFDSEETTNENAKTKFANNTLTFGNGSKSASIAMSTLLDLTFPHILT